MAMKETTISSGNLCDIFERALNGNVRSATILLKNGIAGRCGTPLSNTFRATVIIRQRAVNF